jgi:radical SAM superfamily enzyme YgiQ (UPF0313 family)
MHLWSYTAYPRLGLPMIGAALKAAGHDVRIYAPKTAPIDWDDVHGADVVGISTTTSTAPAAYAMGDDLRSRCVPVVMGGSHVTFMADEALDHADYVARGEGGEELMLELLEVLRGERAPASVRGLSFRRDGTAVHNELRPPCPDLDTLPLPDLDLIAGHEKLNSMPVMTSWGCPFACNFCSVTAMFGRKYRYRSPEHIMAEIEAKQPKSIFFYDDNFAADKRRLKTLLRMMIASGRKISWSAQVRTDVVSDPELLALMRDSGCDRVALGLESVSQETLDGFDKSQSVADIERALATLRKYGIKTHGMFVLGADSDTAETVRETARFARKHDISTLMLNILTPLPGTPLFDELDAGGRIFDRRWDLFDGQHVVFTPRKMTPDRLQTEVWGAYARFYSFRQWLKYLATFRYGTMALYSWYWVFLRRWRKEKGNRDYLEMLKQLAGPSPAADSQG